MAAEVHLTVKLVHVGVGVWCPHCLRSSGVCLRGTVGGRWFTRRMCRDCCRDIKENDDGAR